MQASTDESGGSFAAGASFVFPTAAGESALGGVAALDSPAVQQTKAEIRSLAAEMAQLAQAGLAPDEFYEGFLPRLCAAMGAKAAGVWQHSLSGPPLLVADHGLPSSLIASSAHERILQCVAAEGQPMLVPPGNVRVQADRPSNPLSEALLLVPLRLEENIEYLLEVVHRPSGGPAAQRGYLRFVAQMGDLMADALRRDRLRAYAAGRQRAAQLQSWLTGVAAEASPSGRGQRVAEGLCELFEAERVVLLAHGKRGKVLAVSGSRGFDPRSESILAARAVHAACFRQAIGRPAEKDGWPSAQTFTATDRRGPAASQSSQAPQSPDQPLPAQQRDVDRLCESLAARHGGWLPLDRLASQSALLLFSAEHTLLPIAADDPAGEARQIIRGFGGLLQAEPFAPGWWSNASRWWPAISRDLRQSQLAGPLSWLAVAQTWILRAAVLGLLVAVALFPVSQQIAATAVLQPLSKEMYYAPAVGVVSEVWVDDGQAVEAGTQLLRLTSHDLETQAESLEIELKKCRGQIEEKLGRLNRGEALSSLQRDQLEFEVWELETAVQSLQLQRDAARARLDELQIVARQPGTVSTWDVRNRLLNHPVQPGQLLTSTYNPHGKWRLLLSIPDYRAGLVAAALHAAPQSALPVHFSLTSHPDRVLEAFAVDMAPQVTMDSDGTHAAQRVVRTAAYVRDADELPLKKDGAIARATIECGKVPLAWLVVRDAYWAVSSWCRMLW